MKKQKIIFLFLCLLLLAALPVSASAARANKVIILYEDEIVGPRDVISVVAGESITLTAETDEDADAEESEFTWRIGNVNFATINGEAVVEDEESVSVEGVKKGLTTVTAFSKSRSAKYSVNVRVIDALVEEIEVVPPITFDPEEDALVDKQSLQLRAIVKPTDADIKAVTWKVTLADCDDPFDKESEACMTRPPATISTAGKLTASGVSAETEVKVWAISADGSGVMGDLDITLMPRARRLLIFNNEDIGDYSIEIPDAHADPYHFWACQADDAVCYYPNLTNKVSPIIKDLTTTDKYIDLIAMLDWGYFLEDTSKYGEDPGIVKWSSSNKKVAEVDSNGRVTFYKAGTVKITAQTTDGSKLSATVQITARIMVEYIEIHEAGVPENNYTLAAGKSMRLKAVVYPSTATLKKLEWWSSDPAVATVSGSGVVKAANLPLPRSVTIYVRATDADPRNQEVYETFYDITVYPKTSKVILTDQTGAVVTGKTIYMDMNNVEDNFPYYYLRASVEPLYYATQECIWSSSNEKVIQVDQNGDLTLIKDGSAVITAKAADGSGVTGKVKVVIRRLITDITIIPEDNTMRGGQKMKVHAVIDPEKPTKKALKWYSSDPTVFTVSGGAATATITSKNVNEKKCANVYAEAADGAVYLEDDLPHRKGDPLRSNEEEICVYPAVRAVKIILDDEDEDITGRTYFVRVGDTLVIDSDFKAIAYPETGEPEPFTWSTSSKKVLSFDNNSTFTAMKLGAARITAKANDGSGKSAEITVKIIKDSDYEKLPGFIYSMPEDADQYLTRVSEESPVIPEYTTETAENDIPADGSEADAVNPEEQENIEAEITDSAVTEIPSEGEEAAAVTEETSAEGEVTENEVSGDVTEETVTEPEGVSDETAAEQEPADEPSPEAETVEPAPAEESADEDVSGESEVPAVEEISVDLENETITVTVGQTVRIESSKVSVLPTEADWNTLTFEVENEYFAKLETDEIEAIREDGLLIDALTVGETKLVIRSGEAEKTVRIVVEAAPVITEEQIETVPAAEEPVPDETVSDEVQPAEDPAQDTEVEDAAADQSFPEPAVTEESDPEPLPEENAETEEQGEA